VGALKSGDHGLVERDVARVVEACPGVVVKVIIEAALLTDDEKVRACGLGVMLGCMISSSVSTTAAAHLSPLVDYADLDGHLLIANDRWSGVEVREGRLTLPDRPGLGLISREGEP
jgi:hypothetical protein